MSGVKKIKILSKRKFLIFMLLLCVFYTTCEMPLGLGESVDTVAPTILIASPVNNQFLDGIISGEPINLTGSWSDDKGVTELSFNVYNRTESKQESIFKVNYAINKDGTWSAKLIIVKDSDKDYEYDITVLARDKFNNEGGSTVRVRIEIIPPWLDSYQILRHQNTSFGGFSSNLRSLSHYRALGFQQQQAYRDIPRANLDEFQNERFTLKVNIKPAFSGLAASRLLILNENGEKLHNDALPPTRNGDTPNPEWDIDGTTLSMLSNGAHFIQFRILAWSKSAWDENTNSPKPGEPYREQNCSGGTVWYQTSDRPKIFLEKISSSTNMVTLLPDTENALTINFYDDDKLGEIYAGFILKSAFDSLLGGLSEEAYFAALETDSSKRTAVLAALGSDGANRFNAGETSDNGRSQSVRLRTGVSEEYRLIALVKESKPAGEDYSFEIPMVEKWTSYPSLRVQVQNLQQPLIFIESPEKENEFPDLSAQGGESFKMSGYVLDRNETVFLQIAWAPGLGVPQADITSALNIMRANPNAGTAIANSDGRIVDVGSHKITVWNVQLGAKEGPKYLNGVDYYQSNFSQIFHIKNDFMRTNVDLNNKTFTIRAINNSGNDSSKTFRITGNTSGPNIEVTSHGRGANHNVDNDLVLSMKVSPGGGGVALDATSFRIYDSARLAIDSSLFTGPITQNINGDWTRTITSSNIKGNYNEGESSVLIFEAKNILGVATPIERTIIMSNKPMLETITCSNGSGTYGIGTALRFEATFSMPVRVPETLPSSALPALRLYASPTENGNPAVFKTAEFVETAGNTVIFRYEIKEGDLLTADKLYTAIWTNASSNNSLHPFVNHSSIRSSNNDNVVFTINEENSLQSNADIRIDGIRPAVRRASFVQINAADSDSYFNNGKNITMKLYMSEQVQVSGTPAANISYGTETLKAQFSSITKEILNGKDICVLNFTHTLNDLNNNIPLRQLSLANLNFENFPSGTDITDIHGNHISNVNLTAPAAAINGEKYDSNDGINYPAQRAWIKTTKPAAPVFTLHNSLQSANNNTNLLNGDVRVSSAVGLRVTGVEQNVDVYYSLFGGNNRELPRTANFNTEIIDVNYANRFDVDNYSQSQYEVTVWQVDKAGNSSENAASRNIVINSRWPELRGVDFGVPDGSYKNNTTEAPFVIPIKINFSRIVNFTAASSVTLKIYGTDPANTDPLTIESLHPAASGSSAMITLNWPVKASVNMKNIKVGEITFTGITDEFGNTLTSYSGSYIESPSNSNRPISGNSAFQISRPNLEIIPIRPKVISASPALPAAGVNSNGFLLTGSTITFAFSSNVSPVPGNNIVIRPYGEWAIPPVLTMNEFNAVYNADFRTFSGPNDTTGTSASSANKSNYQRRLRDVDSNNIPNSGSQRGSGWNLYTRNTHGITGVSGNIRPDTATKMVLDFETDLYTGQNAANLREVFNAARWKWQSISVSSGFVRIVDGNKVEIIITQPLLDGRIWEVIMPEGAFQDGAGNPSEPVKAGDYRFWSQKTASPVIRSERISYDANNFFSANVALGFVTSAGVPQRPPIDTRVRIDCETPGADIRYDYIRTSYTFADSVFNADNNNTPFTNTTASDAGFFGAAYTSGGATPAGYTRNNIGNADVSANKDGDGFFTGLLVPRTVQTPASGVSLTTNGVISINSLASLGTNIISDFTTKGSQYRTVTAGTAAETFSTPRNSRYFFIGDAFGETLASGNAINAAGGANNITGPATVNTDTHRALFSGRRDYIIAVAHKKDITVNSNAVSGPQLNVSSAGMEGVYKTNLLYRNPQRSSNNVWRVLVQGFDLPVIPVVAGFPLRDADSTNSDTNSFNNYFSKSAYRVGGGGFGSAPSNTASSHYIWVTWEIVTDWYQKGKGYNSATNGNYLNNNNNNANSIAASYGAVIYRYQQAFY